MTETLGWLLYGKKGLRAGWSILLLASVLAGLGLLARLVFGSTPPPTGALPPRPLLISALVSAACVLFATSVVKAVERRPWQFYGFSGNRILVSLGLGWGAGLVTILLVSAGLYGSGLLHYDGLAEHGAAIAAFGAAWLVCLLIAGMFEEALFRGCLQATLSRAFGFWPAASITSVLFAVAHEINGGETASDIAGILIVALSLCLLLRVSGSLWLGIGFHGSLDWSQAYLFSLPDNGVSLKGHLLLAHFGSGSALAGGLVPPGISFLISLGIGLGAVLLAFIVRRFLHKKGTWP